MKVYIECNSGKETYSNTINNRPSVHLLVWWRSRLTIILFTRWWDQIFMMSIGCCQISLCTHPTILPNHEPSRSVLECILWFLESVFYIQVLVLKNFSERQEEIFIWLFSISIIVLAVIVCGCFMKSVWLNIQRTTIYA